MKQILIKKLIKRTFLSFLMVLSLIIIIFFLMRILPGDPFQTYYSPQLGKELAEKIKIQYGLDKPVYVQFFRWVKNTLSGDFGYSFIYKKKVTDLIYDSLKVTLLISFSSFLLQIILTIPLGLFLLKKKGSWIDEFIDKLALIIYSAPSFVIAIALIYLGSIVTKLFPSSQLHSHDFYQLSFIEKFFDILYHITLPVFTLTLTSISFSIRYLRESLIKTSTQYFVIALRASGIPENKIRYRHILPNALISYITILGMEIGSLLNKTLVTESIFSLPGIGWLMVNSIFARDYPVIIACVLITCVMVIIGNLIADLLIARFNPQLALESI